MRAQPLAMCERHHEVFAALKNDDGDVDRAEVESPRMAEREVVIKQSVHVVLERALQGLREPLGSISVEEGHVARGQQAGHRLDNGVGGGFCERLAHGVQVRAQHLFALKGSPELLDVVLTHAGEEVQVWFAVGPDPGHDQCPQAAAAT